MYCRLFFSTKMSGSLTFNSVSSYRIFKSLTSFIRHCCSCHQWRSRTESLPDCLPMCLLSARKFLSGFHPTYHLGMRKMIIRHALGKPPPGKQRPCTTTAGRGRRCAGSPGEGTAAMVLSGSTAGKTAPQLIDWASDGTEETAGPEPFGSRLLPFHHKVWNSNSRFLPSGPYCKLQDIH